MNAHTVTILRVINQDAIDVLKSQLHWLEVANQALRDDDAKQEPGDIVVHVNTDIAEDSQRFAELRAAQAATQPDWKHRALEAEAALAQIHKLTGRGDGHGSTKATLECIIDGILSIKESLGEAEASERDLEAKVADLEYLWRSEHP